VLPIVLQAKVNRPSVTCEHRCHCSGRSDPRDPTVGGDSRSTHSSLVLVSTTIITKTQHAYDRCIQRDCSVGIYREYLSEISYRLIARTCLSDTNPCDHRPTESSIIRSRIISSLIQHQPVASTHGQTVRTLERSRCAFILSHVTLNAKYMYCECSVGGSPPPNEKSDS